MNDDIDVEEEIGKIERTLADQFDGGPVPDRFVTGQPGTSTRFHTQVCHYVANNIRNSDFWKQGHTPPMKEVSDRAIEYHGLTKCPACSSLEERVEETEDDGCQS